MSKRVRLTFIGNLTSLAASLAEHHQLVNIIVEGNRTSAGLEQVARANGARLTTVHNRRDLPVALADAQAEVAVMSSFGWILTTDEIRQAAENGLINIHFGLLPGQRGRHPIEWAVLRGDHLAGVTAHMVTPAIDKGPILAQASTEIAPWDTDMSVFTRLEPLAGRVALRALDSMDNDLHVPVETFSWDPEDPPLTEGDARVRWESPIATVDRIVRSQTRHAGAWALWQGRKIRFRQAYPLTYLLEVKHKPGTILHHENEMVVVACQDGCIALKLLEPLSGCKPFSRLE